MLAHRLLSIVLGTAVASSCLLPVYTPGTVTLAWSIGEASNRESCEDRSATFVQIAVFDDLDDLVEIDEAPCDSFRSRYVLDRGWYAASLTLLDARRNRVSETQDTNAFYVAPHVDAFVEVEFAAIAPPP